MSRSIDFDDGFTSSTASTANTLLASDITVLPTGNLSSTNTQDALVELQSDIDTRALQTSISNMNNTSDINKPVSTAQAAADSAVQAYSIQRANHTGTQTAATVSDFSAATDARIDLQKAAANGLATLGADLKIPSSQLPAIAITDTFVVASQAAMLALTTAHVGDVAVRSDLNKTFILRGPTYSTLTDWQELLTPTDSVLSVNGYVGAVTLTKTDIGLGLADNTSDNTKNSSVATLTNKVIDAVSNTISNIANGNIASGAAIAYSKLNLGLSVVNADISASAAIIYSKLNLALSIVNADISATAAIAYSKLNLALSIVNGDISATAAIALSKLAALSVGKVLQSNASTGVIEASSVTNTELGYVSGVTSSIQTQINSNSTAIATKTSNPMTNSGDTIVGGASGTPTRLGIGTEGNVLTVQSGVPVWLAGGGGGGGAVNLITNGTADSATSSIFVPYLNTAQSRPVNGTGGSPTVTTSLTSTAPLAGTKSFLLTKPASNTQGQGWAIPFNVDLSQRAKVIQISIDYIVNSGTFVAGTSNIDSDIIWTIYDVTNSQIIEPSSIKLLSNSTTLSDKFSATFQTSATGSSYRLIAHVASTSALAYEIKCEILVSPSVYVYGTPVTDMQDAGVITIGATTTAPSKGTTSADKVRWQRIGDQGHFVYEFKTTAGGTGAGDYLVSLPAGLSFDSTKISFFTGSTFDSSMALGTSKIEATQSAQSFVGTGSVVPYDATRFRVIIAYVNANTNTPYAVIWGAGNLGVGLSPFSFSADFMASLAGMSASVQMSDQTDTRVVVLTGNTVSSAQALTGGVTDITFNATKDSHAAWNGTQYKVPVAGDYSVSANIYSAASSFISVVYKNGSAVGYLGYAVANEGGGGNMILPNLKVGDLISIRSGSTVNLQNDTSQNISICRISGPSAIASSESVNAKYTNTAGTSFSAGVEADVPFATKVFDSHSAYTSPSYLILTTGKYRVSGGLLLQAVAIPSSQSAALKIYINGAVASRISQVTGNGTSNAYCLPSGSDTFNLVAGDTVKLRFVCDATVSLSTGVGDCHFSIEKVGQ
jgi:hypothetical protein